MTIYKTKRGQGKTLSLIYASMYTRYPIVCYSKTECTQIVETATQLGINIPCPYTMEEFLKSGGKYEDNILIDNLDIMLPKILNDYFKCNVCGATMNTTTNV